MKQEEGAFFISATERVKRLKNDILWSGSHEQLNIFRFKYSSRLVSSELLQFRSDALRTGSEREDEKLKSFTREAGLLIDGRQFLLDVRGNIFFFQFSDGFFLIGMLYEKLRQRMRLFYFPRVDEKKRCLGIRFFHEAFQKIEHEFFLGFSQRKGVKKHHHLLGGKKALFTSRRGSLHIIRRPLILEIKDEKLRSRVFFVKGFLEDAPAFIDTKTVFTVEKKYHTFM